MVAKSTRPKNDSVCRFAQNTHRAPKPNAHIFLFLHFSPSQCTLPFSLRACERIYAFCADIKIYFITWAARSHSEAEKNESQKKSEMMIRKVDAVWSWSCRSAMSEHEKSLSQCGRVSCHNYVRAHSHGYGSNKDRI